MLKIFSKFVNLTEFRSKVKYNETCNKKGIEIMSQQTYDRLINSPRGFANASMRDVLLPLILGKETDGILYWIGKDLARQYPVATPEEITQLAQQLGFGELTRTRQKRTTQNWQLRGAEVSDRLNVTAKEDQPSFTLEAGFLAQELQFQIGTTTEARVQSVGRGTVELIVQSDPANDDEEQELVTFIHLQGSAEDQDQASDDPKSDNPKSKD